MLVLLIDALRADRLGCYGQVRNTSPHIDQLAAESLLFENVHAQSPWTKPSIPTLFTSLYPAQHGVYEGEAHAASGALESDVLAEEYTTLAEAFRAAGYATVAFVHNAHLAAAHGFSQGFDVYEQEPIDAPEINRRFLDFLDGDSDRPFFAYLHYLDVHWPFQPDEPFRGRFADAQRTGVFARASWRGLRDRINDGTIQLSDDDRGQLTSLHDAGIAQLDQRVGELLDALRQRRLLEHTVVLLTSDHGEELLDHGKVGHGGTLFREVIEIPLMIRVPGQQRVGRVTEAARLLDVLPTLLRVAGVALPRGLEGRDLLAEPGEAPEIVAETRHKRTYRVSVRHEDWKYIRTYRARRFARSGAHSPSSFGLAAGLRVKAKGLFSPDGILHAEKLTLKNSIDDDVELSGPIEFVRADENVFGIHGIRIDGQELMADDGGPLVHELVAGEWVKVEGMPADGRSLEADKLERLTEGDRNDELEGIIERLEELPDGEVRVLVGNVAVVVTGNTRLKGFPTPDVSPRPTSDDGDPFAPARLLSTEAPPFEEQLFDLASDPREQTDRASHEPERVVELGARLEAWFTRMSRHIGARADRQSLDPASIEELRILGYLE